MENINFGTVITSILSSGVIVTILLNFFLKRYSDRTALDVKKKFDEQYEKPRLLCELKDINRHCKANLAILSTIDLSNGKPSSVHFKKMKIYETSILFSNETYRVMPLSDLEKLYALKTIVRNRNFEFDRIVDYLEKEPYDSDEMSSYISYVNNTMNFCAENINEDYFLAKRKTSSQLIKIVYHKSIGATINNSL